MIMDVEYIINYNKRNYLEYGDVNAGHIQIILLKPG